MSELKQELELGIAFLDVVNPSWRDLVNIDTLDMGNTFNCLMAQVFVEEWKGLASKNVLSPFFVAVMKFSKTRDWSWAQDHGFMIRAGESHKELTEEWVTYLRLRGRRYRPEI